MVVMKYLNLLKSKKLNNIKIHFDINLRNKIKNFDIVFHLSKREGLFSCYAISVRGSSSYMLKY